jgi:hypothetical protein
MLKMSDRFVLSSDGTDHCPELNHGVNFDKACEEIINSILVKQRIKLDSSGMLKLKMDGMKELLAGLFKKDRLLDNDKLLLKNALKLQYD